jgi:hypothetical protein
MLHSDKADWVLHKNFLRDKASVMPVAKARRQDQEGFRGKAAQNGTRL